jgi:uncharacterized membrane protein YecN with MAPEG domain
VRWAASVDIRDIPEICVITDSVTTAISPGELGAGVGYPFEVPTLFRRKNTADLVEPTVEETAESEVKRAYTPSKREQGVATPKRATTGRRVGAAPADRKEALAQNRETRRQKRIEDREAMMRGEDHALLPRDRGPERRLVRDIVDSRRNASSYFLFGLVLILFLSMIQTPLLILVTYGVMLFLLLTVVIDGFTLSRRIKRIVRERLPKSEPRWGGLYFYGIMRSTQFRKMRVPRPRIKVGDPI